MSEINLIFKHQNKTYPYKCTEEDNIADICAKIKEKIKLNRIFFIYEGIKINLELNMRVGEQLQIDPNKKKKKKYEINVYDEPIQIKFGYLGKDTFLTMKENEKMEDVLRRFATTAEKDFDYIYFLYGGDAITEDKYNFSFDDFANKMDKDASTMSIAVNDVDRDSICINDVEPKEPKNEYKKLDIVIDPQVLEQRKFYLYFLLILIIQYLNIVFFSWLGFFLKFNDLLSTDKYMLLAEVIPALFMLIVMSLISNEALKNYKKSNYLIIYHVFSTLFTIYFALLLSKYVDSKYIITSLSLVLIEIVAMYIYMLLFKNHKKLFLYLSCSISSLIGLILFSSLWIKDLLPIIFISIFWIFSLGFLFLNIQIILKLCKPDEYHYGGVIINYGLFLLIALGLKYIYDYLIAKYEVIKEDLKIQINAYFLLIFQTLIIIIFVGIGLNHNWNSFILESWRGFNWLLIPTSIINLIMCVIAIILIDEIQENLVWSIYHVLYIPFVIIYCFLVSKFVEGKFILALLTILLFNMIAVALYIFIFNSDKKIGIFFSPFIMNIITIIFVHFFWLNENKAIIANSIIPLAFIIIWTVVSSFDKEESTGYYLLFYDYGIFMLIYALTVGLIALAFYLLGLLCMCLGACFGGN